MSPAPALPPHGAPRPCPKALNDCHPQCHCRDHCDKVLAKSSLAPLESENSPGPGSQLAFAAGTARPLWRDCPSLPAPRPRCSRARSVPTAPEDMFCSWAPGVSLLNKVRGDKCHCARCVRLHQQGHPFLRRRISICLSGPGARSERASQHAARHAQHKASVRLAGKG